MVICLIKHVLRNIHIFRGVSRKGSLVSNLRYEGSPYGLFVLPFISIISSLSLQKLVHSFPSHHPYFIPSFFQILLSPLSRFFISIISFLSLQKLVHSFPSHHPYFIPSFFQILLSPLSFFVPCFFISLSHNRLSRTHAQSTLAPPPLFLIVILFQKEIQSPDKYMASISKINQTLVVANFFLFLPI